MSKKGRERNRQRRAERKAREAHEAAGLDICLISHLRTRSITECLPEWLGAHDSEAFNSITVISDSANEPSLLLLNEFAAELVGMASGEPMPPTFSAVSPDENRRYLIYRMSPKQLRERLQLDCALAGVLWDEGYQCTVRPAEKFEDSLSDLQPWRDGHAGEVGAS